MSNLRQYRLDLIGLFVVALLLTFVKAPLFPDDPDARGGYEADEYVYRTLAQRLGETPPRYDLQGSWILEHKLDRKVYDRPLFLHPPLFAWTMHIVGVNILVPLASNAITLFLVWWIGLRLFDRPRARLAAALYACCPVAFLCASRLWIDGYLTMWVTASIASMIYCLDRKHDAWFLLPGTCLGLALLSKFTAICTVAPLLAMWVYSKRPFRWTQAVALALPGVLILMPWLVECWSVYHGLGYHENRLDDEAIKRFPFLLMARNRPVWFYFGGLVLVAPIHLFSYWGMLRTRWDLVAWPLAFIVAFTIYGPGNSFQTRFIAPAMPGMCLLAANMLWTSQRRWLLAVAAVFALYGLYSGYFVGVIDRLPGDAGNPYLFNNLPGLF